MRKTYIMTDEHKKAISEALKRKFANMTPEEQRKRVEKRVLKAKIKNLLYDRYILGLIKL